MAWVGGIIDPIGLQLSKMDGFETSYSNTLNGCRVASTLTVIWVDKSLF